MFKVNLVTSLTGELSRNYSQPIEVEAGSVSSIEEVFGGATTTVMAFPLDVSQAKALALLSTKAVTVKVNSAGSPSNTFTLAANVPFLWALPQGALKDTAAAAVTVDFVQLHVVNAGADAGVLTVDALHDPTV